MKANLKRYLESMQYHCRIYISRILVTLSGEKCNYVNAKGASDME